MHKLAESVSICKGCTRQQRARNFDCNHAAAYLLVVVPLRPGLQGGFTLISDAHVAPHHLAARGSSNGSGISIWSAEAWSEFPGENIKRPKAWLCSLHFPKRPGKQQHEVGQKASGAYRRRQCVHRQSAQRDSQCVVLTGWTSDVHIYMKVFTSLRSLKYHAYAN